MSDARECPQGARNEEKIIALSEESDIKDGHLRDTMERFIRNTDERFTKLDKKLDDLPEKMMSAVEKEIDARTQDFVKKEDVGSYVGDHIMKKVGRWVIALLVGNAGVITFILRDNLKELFQ